MATLALAVPVELATAPVAPASTAMAVIRQTRMVLSVVSRAGNGLRAPQGNGLRRPGLAIFCKERTGRMHSAPQAPPCGVHHRRKRGGGRMAGNFAIYPSLRDQVENGRASSRERVGQYV